MSFSNSKSINSVFGAFRNACALQSPDRKSRAEDFGKPKTNDPKDDSDLKRILLTRSGIDDPYRSIVERRRDVYYSIQDEESVRFEIARCRADPAYFVSRWGWTFDPRLVDTNPVIPFDLFPKQTELINWFDANVNARKSGLVEKCREVGVTWVAVFFQLHHWLFVPGFKGTFASRKEKLVDSLGDPDTIFEKIRIAIRFLPHFLKPDRFDAYMRLINFETDGTITGQAGDQIGRGGRSTCIVLDEAAFLPHGAKVDRSTSFNSDSVFWVSSVNGMSNTFAQIRHSGRMPVFRFDWFDDPRKDREWLRNQEETKDKLTLEQEVFIRYQTSGTELAIDGDLVDPPLSVDIKPTGKRVAALDVATSGTNVFIVRQGSVVIHIESWSELNTIQTTYRAIDLVDEWDVSHFVFDAEGLGEGVGSTLATYQAELDSQGWELAFTYYPFKGSRSPSDFYWVGDQCSSKDKFLNLRAESIWLLRERLKKTKSRVEGFKFYEDSECIKYPNHAELRAQIPIYKYFRSTSGKIGIESKQQIAKRGLKSPDFLEALYMVFAQDAPDTGGDAVTVHQSALAARIGSLGRSQSLLL